MEQGGDDASRSGLLQHDEKLAHFQSLTGVEDMALCSRILQSHNWDLDAAVSSALADPRYPPAAPIPSSAAPLGLQSPAHLNPAAVTTLTRHQPAHPAAGSLVWKIVTLPFNIVRGGLSVATGAVGLGVWVAGSLISYSLGAVGLGGGEPSRGRSAATPGAVQAAAFVQSLEREYGVRRPGFVPLSFMEALRRASEEFKFMFVYLHSPEHVDTPAFCEQTLCSEAVVEFLDRSFVCWGADVRSTEGFQMFNSLKASTFPFCAVVMASSNQRIALLQQIDGMKPAETLISMLQRVLDDQGPALVAQQAEEEERRRNRLLREEQDAAYQAALQADQERERQRVEEAERQAREAEEQQRQIREKELAAERAAEQRQEKARALGAEPERGPNVTQVLVRFPNGERKERRFSKGSTVQSVYDYVDSLGFLADDARYSLVSNFPRTVYSDDKLGLSLTEAGLHPHASLFVQVESL